MKETTLLSLQKSGFALQDGAASWPGSRTLKDMPEFCWILRNFLQSTIYWKWSSLSLLYSSGTGESSSEMNILWSFVLQAGEESGCWSVCLVVLFKKQLHFVWFSSLLQTSSWSNVNYLWLKLAHVWYINITSLRVLSLYAVWPVSGYTSCSIFSKLMFLHFMARIPLGTFLAFSRTRV